MVTNDKSNMKSINPVSVLYSNQKIQFKEEEGEFYSEGFVATTHKDREGDILTEGAIKKIVESINNKFLPQAGVASNRHDWIKQKNPDLPLAGRAIEADVRRTEDGHLGAHVRTHHHKLHPEFGDIKYNVQHGYYPGYSIEFEPVKTLETGNGRLIEDLNLVGYGLANLRKIANPHAVITDFGYKEIYGIGEMRSNEQEQGDVKVEQIQVKEDKIDVKEKKETVEVKQHSISESDFALLQAYKDQSAKEVKMKELYSSVKDAVEKEIKEQMKNRPLYNTTNEQKVELKEVNDFKNSLAQVKELDKPVNHFEQRTSVHQRMVKTQYKEAAKLHNALSSKNMFTLGKPWENGRPAVEAEFKESGVLGGIEIKESDKFARIEVKGLDTASNAGSQLDTNLAHASWTYGSYYQAPVELNDIYQPIVVNQLNDMTTTWGLLRKENFSGYSQIQFRARTGRNSTAAGYSEGTNYTYGTDFSGQVGRDKFQQPFCYYHVLVAVTGQAQRFSMSPGGMGDRWADEIQWSTRDLLRVLNSAIIGTGAGSSEATSLGFEILFQGTTGTLFGKNIATYATLRSHQQAMSSARVDINQLRLMIERVQTGTGSGGSQVHSNAKVSDLVFICHPTQERFIKALLQDMQRLIPTSARAGFEGRVELDGVPVFTDVQMNTDDIFLIDTSATKLGINLAPTLEPLPVTADAQAAHIKIYFNLYSESPGNNFWASGFSTS